MGSFSSFRENNKHLTLAFYVGFRALSKSYAFNIQVPCQERSSFLFPFFVVQIVFGI